MKHADPKPYAFLGVFIIVAGMILSAAGYGHRPFTYSCLNHFVSELGNHHKSQTAIAYNLGLIFGGLSLIFPAVSVGRISRPASISLTASVVGVVLLGIIPESSILVVHVMIAAVTFALLEAGVILLGAKFASDADLPRRLRVLGCTALTTFVSILFLLSPKERLLDSIGGSSAPRPDLWLLALMEWLFLASIGIWVIVLSSSLHRDGRTDDTDLDGKGHGTFL